MIDVNTLIDKFNYVECKAILPNMYSNFIVSLSIEELKNIIKLNKEEINFNKLLILLLDKMSDCQYKEFQEKVNINVCKEKLQNDLYHNLVCKKTLGKFKKLLINKISTKYDDIVNEVFCSSNSRFYELFDYQISIKEKILTLLESNIPLARMLIHMPTGTGKTKTAMHAIVNYFQFSLKNKGMILWIAHTNTLLEQAEETLKNVWFHLGNGEISIYRLYANYKVEFDKLNSGIMFVSVNKLINSYKKNDVLYRAIIENCDLIVFDEAHKSTAKTTKYVIEDMMSINQSIKKRRLIGLTATPGRVMSGNYNENNELALMYEKNMISVDPYIIEKFSKIDGLNFNNISLDNEIIHYFQERKILAKLKRHVLAYDYNFTSHDIKELMDGVKSNSEDYNTKVINVFENNYKRNMVIIDTLIDLDKNNISTIVFACSIKHGKFLFSMLASKGIVAKQIYGNTSVDSRRNIINEFKSKQFNILINCDVLTTGFDSTNIKCVFITKPTKSIILYSQMIGRGLRGPKMGGNESCLLIDLKDNIDRFSNESVAFKYFDSYWR